MERVSEKAKTTGSGGKLSVEQTFRMIAAYRMNVCLWDTKNAGYRNRELRARALDDMARTCDGNVADVETYIHSLRTGYIRQLKRVYASRNASRQYVPRWIYFQQLDFLRSVIQPRTRRLQYPPAHHRLAAATASATATPEPLADDSVAEWSDDADSVVFVDTPGDWSCAVQPVVQERVPDPRQIPYDDGEEVVLSPPEVKYRPSPPSLTLAISDTWEGGEGEGDDAGSPTHPSDSVQSEQAGSRSREPFRLQTALSITDGHHHHAPTAERHGSGGGSSTAAAAFGQFVGTYVASLTPDDQHRAMLEIHQLLFQFRSSVP